DDLQLTDQSMSYDGGAKAKSTATIRNNPLAAAKSDESPSPKKESVRKLDGDWPIKACGKPDFGKMTSAQRKAFDQARLKRAFG
ncbi:MAG: hypothetical protein ACI9VS_004477, partial [Candidatus Binatia bacterium]